MSNEEMALLIKNGQDELLPGLWDNIQDFVYLYSNRFYNSRVDICKAAGVEVCDLVQTAYFSMIKAIEAYNGMTEYKFLTFMSYHLKNAFNELVGLRGPKQALNRSKSLSTPLGDDEDTTLLDTIESPAEDMKQAEAKIYTAQLRKDLDTALGHLEPIQEGVIKEVYYNGFTVEGAGERLNITPSQARNARENGLRALRKDKRLKEYRNDIISRYGYKSSFSAWYHKGASSTEYTALKLIENEKDYLARKILKEA